MHHLPLSFLVFAITLAVFNSASALELSRSLPASDIAQSPNTVRFLIFDGPEAIEPIEIADFGPGQYRLEERDGQIIISAELLQDIDPEGLWIETELDGEKRGHRERFVLIELGVTFALGNNLDMDGSTITNLEMSTPGVGTDAANRFYVDDAVAAGGDNLGNHTASSNIQLGSHWLSGDGNSEGIKIDQRGDVNIGAAQGGYVDLVVSGRITALEEKLYGHIEVGTNVRAGSYVVVGESSAECINQIVGAIRFDRNNGNFYGCSNDANDNGTVGDFGWMKLH